MCLHYNSYCIIVLKISNIFVYLITVYQQFLLCQCLVSFKEKSYRHANIINLKILISSTQNFVKISKSPNQLNTYSAMTLRRDYNIEHIFNKQNFITVRVEFSGSSFSVQKHQHPKTTRRRMSSVENLFSDYKASLPSMLHSGDQAKTLHGTMDSVSNIFISKII